MAELNQHWNFQPIRLSGRVSRGNNKLKPQTFSDMRMCPLDLRFWVRRLTDCQTRTFRQKAWTACNAAITAALADIDPHQQARSG